MKPLRNSIFALAVIAAGLLIAATSLRADTTFSFQFDNQGINGANASTDGPIIPPLVGTGMFVSPLNLAPGTYALSSLIGFTMSFTFANGDSYTQANIATPITGVSVRIVSFRGGQRLFFTASGRTGSDG